MINHQNAIEAALASLQAVVLALAEMKGTVIEAAMEIRRVEAVTGPAVELMETAAAVLVTAESDIGLIIKRGKEASAPPV